MIAMQAISGNSIPAAIPRGVDPLSPRGWGQVSDQIRQLDLDRITPLHHEVAYLKQIIDFQAQKIDKLISMVEGLYAGRNVDGEVMVPVSGEQDQLLGMMNNMGRSRSGLLGNAPPPPPPPVPSIPVRSSLSELVKTNFNFNPRSPPQSSQRPPPRVQVQQPSPQSPSSISVNQEGSASSSVQSSSSIVPSVTSMPSLPQVMPGTGSHGYTLSSQPIVMDVGNSMMNDHMSMPPDSIAESKKCSVDIEPPRKKPKVMIQFIHNPTTVRQIYDEFTHGYGGQPPLRDCDAKYGKQQWRGDSRSKESKRYQRRKKLVDAIERGMRKYGKPADTIIDYIEQFRGDKSLTWVMNGHLPQDL